MMTGCTNDDNIIDEPQQPENKSNVVTMTTTVSLDGGAATTRALTAGGVKTFAAGETMALVYKNTSSATVKVVSTALTDGDITNEGKSATFTFELTDPNTSQDVTYIYPAAMANDEGTVNYDALATQDGTLATLSSSLDLATYSAAWNGTALPSATLVNQLAILALTLKNSDGSSDITSSTTGLSISDGTNSYAVTPSSLSTIYVAIQPTSSASIEVTATDGTTDYKKSLTGKTYAASNGYSISWLMNVMGKFTVNNSGKKVYFSPGNLQYNNTEATYKWRFAPNQYDYVGAWNTDTWVDLFGYASWGTDRNPLNTSTDGSDDGYKWSSDFTQESSLADANQRGYDWRTPSRDEWNYLFQTRSASTVNGVADARYVMGKVNGVQGVIIFPDVYTHPSTVALPVGANNTQSSAMSSNNYSTDDWSKMENAGAAFLPAAGCRNGTNCTEVNEWGRYWSSTSYNNVNSSYSQTFNTSHPYDGTISTYYGLSVRLVRDVE